MPDCTSCNRSFATNSALRAHRLAKAHFDHYCAECDRGFIDEVALGQHLNNSPVHQFGSDDSDSQIEWEDSSDLDSGSGDDDDDNDAYCGSCDRHFINLPALYQHLAANPVHNWCFVCSRDFKCPQDLEQHNASRVHKPADMKCPLCSKMFKSPSDIANHIESGGSTYHSRINRHHVTAAIHRLDINPPISIAGRLTGPVAAVPTMTEYFATELAFNGNAYECYLCHRQCRTLQGLNNHLNSPAHDDNQFQCPHGKCGKQFTVISGLIRHIESESCGLAKFYTVEKYSNQFTRQFSRLLTL
ncbi:hypothetical protein K435DRAFT_974772 [Dendrothele bispora CBS 962.96]|uniref:C2H2-type domain-containing protein n=1 Tax=Dendrothele bispora (strain CBS 962.96) TaxID=1314807 RepID=A0A4S8KJF9_DENBC|nr:hypothetical protein K435DRAFT_974772 [Dendrothele bispora CBS 962.96]